MKVVVKKAGRSTVEDVTPHQWANDWITAKEVAAVYSPLQVVLEPAEIELFRASVLDAHIGQFWQLWELHEDGRFTKR